MLNNLLINKVIYTKLYPNFAYWETYSTIKILRC